MKTTIFVDLKGKFSDFIKPLYSENRTRNEQLIKLNNEINTIININKNALATAYNCQVLWSKLGDVYAKYSDMEIINDWDKKRMDDIKDYLRNIGKEIAYIGYRKHLDIEGCYTQYVNQIVDTDDKDIAISIYRKLEFVAYVEALKDGYDGDMFNKTIEQLKNVEQLNRFFVK